MPHLCKEQREPRVPARDVRVLLLLQQAQEQQA
jgi:hypothetical protein